MKNLKSIVTATAAVLLSSGIASAADSRTGTISAIESDESSLNFRVWISQTNSNLCGNNGTSGNAYVDVTDDRFENHKSILLAAFLAGRNVTLSLTDTGSSCHIDRIKMQ